MVNEEVSSDKAHANPKNLGAYYTDSQVADFLVSWAVRGNTDTILDPSFGGGVFLRSSCKRLRDLKGDTNSQVFGVEFDEPVHRRISEKLHEEFGVAPANLIESDFFALDPGQLKPVDVIVGNPPFIRYQRFAGALRERALTRAAEQGLRLSQLSSSWLPFLIHSVRFLRMGGRLAMVIPFEIAHAAYASPVLKHLALKFESVTFLTFRKKLFPDLSEDALLLLAEGRHERVFKARFFLRDLQHAGCLSSVQDPNHGSITGVRNLNTERIVTGEERLIEYVLSRKARDLYRELRSHESIVRLGQLADVGIGYVTGANDFFHLAPEIAEQWKIPKRFLRPCVRRGRALSGLRLTHKDWCELLGTGEASYLLELPGEGDLPDTVERYLADGRRRGVNKTFKCRSRSPWYRVPHVYLPDGFLTYMSGDVPRLVANDARVVAPNTLHILRLHAETQIHCDGIAALWRTSLARMSAEVEGHALGGGMLKVEPGEAERVMLPFVAKNGSLEALAVELDQIARSRGDEACNRCADQQLLRRGIGLSASDVHLLRASADVLRERRTSRSVSDDRHR